MFEPLANGLVERVAAAARRQGLRFGFGGIARLDEGLLPGRDVLAEHLRLGSQAVILSRTFHGPTSPARGAPFEGRGGGTAARPKPNWRCATRRRSGIRPGAHRRA